MSRLDRLKEYANPRSRDNWNGAGRDQSNIDRWAKRAEENSKLAPRARAGETRLPDTGGSVRNHDTAAAPRADREIDARTVAKADTNHAGDSTYLRGVRRTGA